MDVAEEEIEKNAPQQDCSWMSKQISKSIEALFQLYFEQGQENGEGISFLSFIA